MIVVEASEIGLKSAVAAAPHVPIVMYANNYDPIERGYVKSLRSPGGNITGVFTRQPERAEKQVELLTQAFPQANRLAMLWNDESIEQFKAAQRRAELLGLSVISLQLHRFPDDIDPAFEAVRAGGAQMLQVLSSPAFARLSQSGIVCQRCSSSRATSRQEGSFRTAQVAPKTSAC